MSFALRFHPLSFFFTPTFRFTDELSERGLFLYLPMTILTQFRFTNTITETITINMTTASISLTKLPNFEKNCHIILSHHYITGHNRFTRFIGYITATLHFFTSQYITLHLIFFVRSLLT